MAVLRIGVLADPHVSVERDEPAAWHDPYRLADSADRLGATAGLLYSGHLDQRALVFAALVEPPYEIASVDLETAPGGKAATVSYECASMRNPEAGVRLPVLAPRDATWEWRRGRGWTG